MTKTTLNADRFAQTLTLAIFDGRTRYAVTLTEDESWEIIDKLGKGIRLLKGPAPVQHFPTTSVGNEPVDSTKQPTDNASAIA